MSPATPRCTLPSPHSPGSAVARRRASALLLAAAFALAAGPASAQTAEARAAAAIGDFREAAELYQQAARNSRSGIEAGDYTLLAAEALLDAREPAAAEALLRRLPPASLDANRSELAGVYRARARLAQGDATGALRSLPSQPESPHTAAALAVRADALFALGDAVGGTTARVLREQVLTEVDLAGNRELLWRALQGTRLPDALPASVEPRVRGWLELAVLARGQPSAEALRGWLVRYGAHPAAGSVATTIAGAGGGAGFGGPPALFQRVLTSLQPAATATAATTGSGLPAVGGDPGMEVVGGFALLLPLNGPLAGAAQAVRAGAIAAMNQAGPSAPLLQIHDSGAGIPAVLAAAIARDAKVVIGPLRKEDVAQIAELAPAVPVVALNYPDTPVPPGMLAFGLAPEDEARSAAAGALGDNRRGALVLALEGDWGERAAAAFREAFIAGGGTVVAEGRLKPGLADYGPSVKPLLGISAAENRSRELSALGIEAEFEAQPRNDLDTVFLALRGRQARLVVPQLRFYNGGELAVFALAAAADSGTGELGSVRVCDVPWRQNAAALGTLRERLAGGNPRAPDTQRLFALGFDAYLLALRQVGGEAATVASLLPSGLSGTLVLEPGAARRQVQCLAALPVNAEDGAPPPRTPVPVPVVAGEPGSIAADTASAAIAAETAVAPASTTAAPVAPAAAAPRAAPMASPAPKAAAAPTPAPRTAQSPSAPPKPTATPKPAAAVAGSRPRASGGTGVAAGASAGSATAPAPRAVAPAPPAPSSAKPAGPRPVGATAPIVRPPGHGSVKPPPATPPRP